MIVGWWGLLISSLSLDGLGIWLIVGEYSFSYFLFLSCFFFLFFFSEATAPRNSKHWEILIDIES